MYCVCKNHKLLLRRLCPLWNVCQNLHCNDSYRHVRCIDIFCRKKLCYQLWCFGRVCRCKVACTSHTKFAGRKRKILINSEEDFIENIIKKIFWIIILLNIINFGWLRVILSTGNPFSHFCDDENDYLDTRVEKLHNYVLSCINVHIPLRNKTEKNIF